MSNALAEISKAEAALERAESIHEILDLRDHAAAMQMLAEAKGFGDAAQKAKVFQLRAERKAGDWLAEHVTKGNSDQTQDGFDGVNLEEVGVDDHESARWQLEAKLPDAEFNKWVDGCIANGKEITAAGLRREARDHQREQRTDEDVKQAAKMDSAGDLWKLETKPLDEFRYHKAEAVAIITDPPYADDDMDAYEELASLSKFCLTDGGSLLAMVGQAHLEKVMGVLAGELTYQWTLAYVMPGAHALMYQRKVNNCWKPILWFVKGKYRRHAVSDLVTAGKREKDRFNWQQSEAGFASLVAAFSRPKQLVIDPMCGTGTTGVAAVVLGRRFVGIDKDPRRIATAKVRLHGVSKRKARYVR